MIKYSEIIDRAGKFQILTNLRPDLSGALFAKHREAKKRERRAETGAIKKI